MINHISAMKIFYANQHWLSESNISELNDEQFKQFLQVCIDNIKHKENPLRYQTVINISKVYQKFISAECASQLIIIFLHFVNVNQILQQDINMILSSMDTASRDIFNDIINNNHYILKNEYANKPKGLFWCCCNTDNGDDDPKPTIHNPRFYVRP